MASKKRRQKNRSQHIETYDLQYDNIKEHFPAIASEKNQKLLIRLDESLEITISLFTILLSSFATLDPLPPNLHQAQYA
jgi:hypothetical protein